MAQELYIKEEEFMAEGYNLHEKLKYMENGLTKLVEEMDAISSEGLVAGNAAQNFVSLADTVKALQGKLENLGADAKILLNAFVSGLSAQDRDPG